MDPKAAAQHASAVAREAVKIGLADQDSVRKLYQDYNAFLQKGVRGTFTQLMFSRKLIDRDGFNQLQAAVPPTLLTLGGGGLSSSLASRASGIVALPPGALGATRASGAFRMPGPPGGIPNLPAAVPMPGEEVGGTTMEFSAVLPLAPPGNGGPIDKSTEGFRQVLAPPELEVPDSFADMLASGDALSLSGEDASAAVPTRRGAAQPKPAPAFDVDEFDPTAVGSTPSYGSGGSGGDFGGPQMSSTAGSSGSLDVLPDVAAPPDAFYMSEDEDDDDDDPVMAEAPTSGEGERTPEPRPGETLSHYLLTKELGRGGMGVIFVAEHGQTKEVVALKVLLGIDEAGADRRRQRFRREIEAMRRLENDHIVKVHDYGRHGPFDWYTMDLIAGADFEEMLLEGEMENADKLNVFEDICKAIAHAHERNVIHRDLKPQNVLVDKSGRGHVLDFGLAKITDQEIGMTRTGSALGTPFYMSPEQLRSAKHIDQRADVFALGVILYEITTGQRPFNGETAAEVGNKILTTDPPLPTKVKKSLHPDIDAICLKALEKDPERRYPDASELLADVIRHRKGFGVKGATGLEGAMGSARRWAARNRAGLIGGLVASVIFIPVVGYLALSGGGDDGPVVVQPDPDTIDPDVPDPDQPDPDAPDPDVPDPDVPEVPDQPDPDVPDQPDPDVPDPDVPEVPDQPDPDVPEVPDQPDVPDQPTERPLEVQIRYRLTPPGAEREDGEAGADRAADENTEAGLRVLTFGLERGVLPAMSLGDTERAKRALAELTRDSRVRMGGLGRQIENDMDTFAVLRELIGYRLEQDDAPTLRTMNIWGGPSRLESRNIEPIEGGFLRVRMTGRGAEGFLILDPLSLDLRILKGLVFTRDREVSNDTAAYALALLGIYRGYNETQLERDYLSVAGGDPAVQRRRRLASWLPQTRTDVWRDFEREAEAAWRETNAGRPSKAALLRGMDDFAGAYGRTEAFRAVLGEYVSKWRENHELYELLSGSNRRGQPKITWDFDDDAQALDFEVTPVKDDPQSPFPFRCEALRGAIQGENIRVRLDTSDWRLDQGRIEVGTESEDTTLVARLDLWSQQVAGSGWTVFYGDRAIHEDDVAINLRRPKMLTFSANPEERIFQAARQKVELPIEELGRVPRVNDNTFLGLETEGDARLTKIEVEWLPDVQNFNEREGVQAQVAARQVLYTLSAKNEDTGQVLMKVNPANMTGFFFTGEWEHETRNSGTLIADRGASMTSMVWADYGVLEFEVAADDGPGVRLVMAQEPNSLLTSSDPSWRLPSLNSPEPTRFRTVRCLFNLREQTASVVVDGVRLPTLTERMRDKAYFRIQFLGRTKGQVRNLRLIQFQPRELQRR